MKLSKNNKTHKKGFTLIELLVVIAIIATLGGLAFGPILNHLNTADVTKATKACKDITFAIDNYKLAYDGQLPYTDAANYPTEDETIESSDQNFLNVLMGLNTTINDKGKEFFTADEASDNKDGIVYDGGSPRALLDKWGEPYKIRLDYDNDGVINATAIGSGESYKSELRGHDAIAASGGPNKKFDDNSDGKSW